MYKRICTVCLSILVLFTLFAVSAVATDTTPQVIRVGYIDNYGTINSPVVQGSEGYGYEYLNTIIGYAQNDYALEFVECTWDTAYDMLDAGEIDIFGPCSYSDSIALDYIYMDNAFGSNSLFLTSLSNETVNTSAYSRLDGATVGVPSNDYDSIDLRDFFRQYDVNVAIAVLNDTDTVNVFETYDIDYYIVSSLQLDSSSSFNFLAQVDTSPIYWIATPDNQDLLDDLDYGLTETQEREYLYQEKLFLEYYDFNISSNDYISPEESALLREQTLYRVGIQNLHSPFSNQAEDGTFTGIGVEFLELLSAFAGINFELVEINDATTEADTADIDFYLFPTQTTTEQAISDPYLEVSLIRIDHKATATTAQNIGILSYYGIGSLSADGTIYGRTTVEFDSLNDMVAAFDREELDSIILSTASLNYIRNDIEDAAYLTSTLDSNMQLVITYSEGFSQEKIDIFNKAITNLDTASLEYALLSSATIDEAFDLLSYVKENPYVPFAIIIMGFLFISLSEVSKRRLLSKQINYDELTGGYSLHKFYVEVEKLRKRNPHQSYQLIALDIDNFKYINEIYGYEKGTQLLKALSTIIENSLQADTLFAREHSDTFLIFAPRTEQNFQSEMHLSNAPYVNTTLSNILGTSYSFSFSIGIYNAPHDSESLSYMVDCANLARELGKDIAGTTFHLFSSEISRERALNNEIVATMDQALSNNEFFMQYQSKIDLHTKELVGAEALVRWKRNGKIVPPNNFIPLFEKNGFIRKLDMHVLEQVCIFINAHQAEHLPKISVNLSGLTVDSPDLIESITNIIRAYDVSPHQIDLEITETFFVGADASLDAIKALNDMGFTISMDDFGAGISSLNRLKNLQIDTLKIDREFIIDYIGNERGAVILKNVLNMAKGLGIETVAEGIETEEQAHDLAEYGCDIGQGFYYSRPIDEALFIDKYFHKKH